MRWVSRLLFESHSPRNLRHQVREASSQRESRLLPHQSSQKRTGEVMAQGLLWHIVP